MKIAAKYMVMRCLLTVVSVWLVKAGPIDRIVKSWAFSKTTVPQSIMEKMDIGVLPSIGFIRLAATPKTLTIDLVQKPENFNGRFCSVYLPAAVRQLFAASKFSIEDLTEIDVTNIATPRIAGCRCYVGLMIAMGMTVVNKTPVTNAQDFCERNTKSYIYGTPGEYEVRLPAAGKIVEKFVAKKTQTLTLLIKDDLIQTVTRP